MFLAKAARGFLCRAVILLCFWSAPATAVQWIELDVNGTPVRSILGVPSEPGPHPAVIFNHGTGVRHLGYEGSKNRGQMDVSRFTDALVHDGYVALAPIRPFNSDTAYVERGGKVGSEQDWTEVVERGIDTVKAALAYLSARDDVMRDKIGVIGFSEGGNVTLWTAAETRGFAAVVLMSPASIRDSGGYRLRNAAARNRVAAIRAPVFLSLGENDLRSIKKVVTRRLVPILQATNEGFEYRLDYPGDHSWFHQLRDDYWLDIAGFLGKHLK